MDRQDQQEVGTENDRVLMEDLLLWEVSPAEARALIQGGPPGKQRSHSDDDRDRWPSRSARFHKAGDDFYHAGTTG